jgi:hypothetical protein
MRAALILGSALLLGACNMSADAQEAPAGGGGNAKRDFQVGAFDKVSLAGSHNVIVSVGGAPSVRAEGDPKVLDRLDIRVEGGELRIGSRSGISISFKSHRSATIYVTVPSLAAASVSGSGDLKVDRVEGARFAAGIAGSGDIDIAALKVEAAEFEVGGSGDIRAAGTAQSASISLAGSGDLSLEGLETRRAKVAVAGSGDVRVRAMETADISIVGSGDVTLSGSAKCTISKMGSGEARCTG